ncbi:MAG TPA: PQQ-binding-like beta-propeller repeat protein [Fimbriiglobus sp.]|nr:PQQ-binding-like beta-propeller repeat protein [Fimbriiglobus sp.]
MRRTACRLALAAFLSFAAAGLAVSQPVPAVAPQAPPAKDDSPKPDGYQSFTFPVERDASQRLEAVIDYMQKKSVPWDIVCSTAQHLLDSKSDSFYPVKDPKTGQETGARVSVKAKINDVIGELPKEGRQFYELTYGPTADAALKQAVQNGYDRAALADISQRYFHTRAGAQATLLLAGTDLSVGNYPEAAYGFQRLLARPETDEFLTSRVLFKAAVAFKRSGDPRQAEAVPQLMDRLAKKFPRDGLSIGTRTYSLDDLKQQLDRPAEQLGRVGDGLVTMRLGNASHTAVSAGGTPFLDPTFTVPMLFRTDGPDKEGKDWVEQNLQAAMKYLDRAKAQVAIPGFFPVTAPGLILYRAYDGVYAVVTRDGYLAYKGTPFEKVCRAGELLWMSEDRGGLQTLMKSDAQPTVKNWWGFWSMRMPSILFENAQAGSLSHDGKLVYFVDDLAIPPPPQVFNPNMGFPGGQMGGLPPGGAGVRGMTEYNRLVALDIDTGKVEWDLGGLGSAALPEEEEQKTADAKLLTENAYFLGPPLPVNGKLYVLYERNNQVRLACLDSNKLVPTASGPGRVPELVWSQNLGAPNTRLNQDSNRRVQPCYLAYADGVVVCPTNCGAVVAVDVNARSLLWARYYGTDEEPPPLPGVGVRGIRRGGFRQAVVPTGGPLPNDRWRAAAPIITQGKVVFTAHDSEHIQCIDLRTGHLLWSDDRKKDDLYVGGVIDGKVLVVGKEAARAYTLAGDKGQPKLAWKNLKIGTPSGHGVASREGLYYVPVVGNPDKKDSTEPQVFAIDVAAGQVRSKTAFRRKAGDAAEGGDPRLALGNLVFHEGMLFSQSAVEVSAFPLIELKRQEMARRLKENPRDPVGLAERGVLSLDNGDVREAIADFKAAQKYDPPEAVRRLVREKLHVAITDLLRNKFEDGEQYLPEYEALCEVPVDPDADPSTKARALDETLRRKGLYLTLLAKGREKQGRLLEAFDAYRAFASLGGNKQLVEVYDEPNGKTRPDVWARGRIDAMIRHAKDPAVRKPLEDRVRRDWEGLKASTDIPKLREFVQVFGPYFPAGRDAQLLLAEKLLQTNSDEDAREAQTQLMRLWATADDPVYAAKAVEALARLMTRRGMLEDAVGLYSQLGTKYADVVVRDGKTGADIYGELITDKRLLPYLEPGATAPMGKYKVDPQTSQTNRPFVQSFAIEPEGELMPFLRRLQLTMQLSPTGDGSWTLLAADRATGEKRCEFSGLSGVQNNMGFQQGAPKYRVAQANGHLLMVNAGQWAYCFDLAEKRELWRYNLLGNAILPTNNPPRMEQDKDGDLLFHYEDGWTLRLGRSSVLEPTYACLVTRDGLVAVDPSNGQKLWVRTDISPKVKVFGDARHVFLVEGTRSKVLRAVDGTPVERVADFAAVVNSPHRIAILGRHVLLCEGDKGRTLRLYDPLTGKDVWKKAYPAPGSVLLKTTDPESTGVLAPDGTFEVLATRTGQSLFKGAVDPGRVDDHMQTAAGVMAVTEPLLLADADRYYLFLNRPPEPGAGPVVYGYTMIRSEPVNGVAYAFDKATGKRLWFHPVFRNQLVLLDRFDELPCIVAAAQVRDKDTGLQQYRVVVLDKQSGKLRYNKGHDQNGFFMTVTPDPKTRAVEFFRYNLRLRIVPDDGATASR